MWHKGLQIKPIPFRQAVCQMRIIVVSDVPIKVESIRKCVYER